MLVLSRKVNESITIGDSIVLTILDIDGDRVKLGVTAPRDVVILRQEVFQAIQEQAKLQELLSADAGANTLDELRKLLTDEDEPEMAGQEKSITQV